MNDMAADNLLKMKPVKNGNRTHLCLCDKDGNVLPGQIATETKTSIDGYPMATVTFMLHPDVTFTDD